MPDKISTLILTVDLQCEKCTKTIKKALCKLQDQGANIKDIVYDPKKNKVIVSGPFDPQCLKKQLCRSKACKAISDIQIKPDDPPPPPPSKPTKPDPPPPPPPEKVPEPPPPSKPTKPDPPPPPPPEKVPEPPPPSKPPPETKPKFPEWAYAYPFAPVFPVCCWSPCPCYHDHHNCRCCSCGHVYGNQPEPVAPSPAPPPMPHYGMPTVYCEGYKIVCEEEPWYTCSIM